MQHKVKVSYIQQQSSKIYQSRGFPMTVVFIPVGISQPYLSSLQDSSGIFTNSRHRHSRVWLWCLDLLFMWQVMTVVWKWWSIILICFHYFIPSRDAEYCDQCVCMSACLSVFLMPAYPDCPGKETVKRMFVCICLKMLLLVTFMTVFLRKSEMSAVIQCVLIVRSHWHAVVSEAVRYSRFPRYKLHLLRLQCSFFVCTSSLAALLYGVSCCTVSYLQSLVVDTLPVGMVANRQSIVMSTSVCVSVCLSIRERIFRTTRSIFTKFLCMLPMAVTRSSSGWEGAILGVFFPVDSALYCIAFGTYTKMAEPIEMLFGLMTLVCPMYHVLDGGPDLQGEGAIFLGKT